MAPRGAISSSVGQNGKNLHTDTKTVQALLNAERGRTAQYADAAGDALTEDGKCGPLTVTAIKAFQSKVMNWQTCDGRIDPDGKT